MKQIELNAEDFSAEAALEEGAMLGDLVKLCKTEGLAVSCGPARGKRRIAEDIEAALNEKYGAPEIVEETPETETVSAAAPPKPTLKPIEARRRDLYSRGDKKGEVIRLARDGKDYGSNLQNRMK